MVSGPRAYRSGQSEQSPPLLFVRFHPSPPPTSFTARGQKTIETPKLQSTQNWGSCLEREHGNFQKQHPYWLMKSMHYTSAHKNVS